MSNSLIEVKDLKVYFKQKSPKLLSFKPGILKAVDQVSFSIEKGKTFGLVGESGSGKSTIGKAILRYHKPTGGEIFYGEAEIGAMGEKELLPYRKKMQSVFQDPYSSLDPSHTVQDIICEPMEIHKLYTPKERKERAKELIRVVGLKEQDLLKYPHEFSGGQRQRISIARALSVQPEFVVCDEPISALDVSLQAQIVQMLQDLQEKYGLTYLFISHQLQVVQKICDEIAILKIILLCLEVFLGMLHYLVDDKHGNRQDQKCCQCHPYIDRQHHDKDTDQCCHRCDQLCHTLVQAHLQRIHIIGHSGKDLTVGTALKIIHRKTVDLL